MTSGPVNGHYTELSSHYDNAKLCSENLSLISADVQLTGRFVSGDHYLSPAQKNPRR